MLFYYSALVIVNRIRATGSIIPAMVRISLPGRLKSKAGSTDGQSGSGTSSPMPGPGDVKPLVLKTTVIRVSNVASLASQLFLMNMIRDGVWPPEIGMGSVIRFLF